MAIWALLNNDKEICQYRAVFDADAREGCEDEAVDLGLAARLSQGVAMAPGAEIICYQSDD
jgi:hypothetical protein